MRVYACMYVLCTHARVYACMHVRARYVHLPHTEGSARTSIEPRGDVRAQSRKRPARNDRGAHRGLNGDLEELAGDDLDCRRAMQASVRA